MSIVRRVVSFTVGVALVPLTAGAQPLGKIVVTPYVGAYAPANELAKMRAHAVGSAVAANVAQRNGLALGATGALWFAPRVSVELGALYVWSDLSSEFAFSQPGSLGTAVPVVDNAGLLMGAAKLMVGLFPATSDFQLRFGAGPAIITRMGSAYKADAREDHGSHGFWGALSLCPKFRSDRVRSDARRRLHVPGRLGGERHESGGGFRTRALPARPGALGGPAIA